MDISKAIPVKNILEEYVFINKARCDCGGSFDRAEQALLRKRRRYYDELTVKCKNCGKERTSFF